MANKKLKKKNAKIQVKKPLVAFSSVVKVVKYSIVSLLVLGAAGASAYYGNQAFKQFLSKPIATVAIEGDFLYMSKEEIAETINEHMQGSFIKESLHDMQRQIEANPWIDNVVLRRQWPDQLHVSIVEQRPIARWGDDGFVNYRGELVRVNNGHMIEGLPVLRGDEKNTLEVMRQYQVLSQAISPYGIHIVELRESRLGIWSLRLDNQWELLAGRTDVVKKVQQLMQILAENKIPKPDEISRIDMRYENGLAIKWKESNQQLSSSLDGDGKNI
ncbi:MAG: cell division protein FtsQ/DivIB [Cellvibrionaceae bacterium]